MAPRLDLRCQSDADLEAKLLAEPEVRHAVEKLEKEGDLGARRHLLATSVRVTAAMAPRLDALVSACRETLGVETPVETYVYPDAAFNAGCVRPEQGRVFVMLSSTLLEAFDDEELRFVVGHELGHHLFAHHRLPVRMLAGEAGVPGPVAMSLFAWSRFAEVSADRAGLVCAGGLEPVARSLFKLASGLKGGLVQMRADDLLAQVGDMREELERAASADEKPRGDWFATHPFSPLRLHAAKHFAQSALFDGSGAARDELEAQVADLMSLMAPSYLKEPGEVPELMRRLLLAGGVVVAAAHGDIDAREKAALDKFFGPGTCDRLNVEALQRDLERRARDVKEKVPALRRQQVVRDLCVIALADGHVAAAERAVLLELAEAAGVGATLVERTLAGAATLD